MGSTHAYMEKVRYEWYVQCKALTNGSVLHDNSESRSEREKTTMLVTSEPVLLVAPFCKKKKRSCTELPSTYETHVG